jgi:transposase
MSEVSILPGRERRRKWTDDEKLSIVEESDSSGIRVADVARRHGLHPNQLHGWRRRARTGELGKTGARSNFVSVAVTPDDTAAAIAPAGRTGLIEFVLRNGTILRVSEHFGLAHLVQLAVALDGGQP